MFKPLLVAVVALPLLLAAHVGDPAYQAANVRISFQYGDDKAVCGALAGQTRDVCYEQARARRNVARAELEFNKGGRYGDHQKVQQARAEAAHAVASARCGDNVKGDAAGLCVERARTVEAQALAGGAQATAVAPLRPDGVVRVQRVAEPLKPAAAPFKGTAL